MLFAATDAKKASSLVLWSNCNEDLYWVTLPAQFCVLDWTGAFLGPRTGVLMYWLIFE